MTFLLAFFFRLARVPLAFAFAVFLGLLFVLASLQNLLPFPLPGAEGWKLFILVPLCCLISVAAYVVGKVFSDLPSYRMAARVLSLAVPLLLAETALLVGLRLPGGSFLSGGAGWAAYVFLLLFTSGLSYRIARHRSVAGALAVFLLLVVSSPLAGRLARHNPAPSQAFPPATHAVKHVILITVDTMRADVLSVYEGRGVPTPHMDQLAKDGILFRQAISPAPWTLPSLASIHTGVSPSVHQAVDRQSKLPDNFVTLAEYMQNAGYHTAALGSNLFLDPPFNLSQGFLEYQSFSRRGQDGYFGTRLLQQLFPRRFRSRIATQELTDLATDWLESNQKKDFFLWIHYFDPHSPYAPPPDFLPAGKPPDRVGVRFTGGRDFQSGRFVPSLAERKWIKDLYQGEVRYIDDNLGKLFRTLKRLHLYEQSVIILTSDHGEEFWEHGSVQHGHSLYQEVLWVPLIIKLPESRSSARMTQPVSTQSLLPTILDLSEIEYEPESLCSSSLVPLWEARQEAPAAPPLISTGVVFYEPRTSVVFDGLKYIRSLVTNREELYELARDPEERRSLVLASPDKAEKGRSLLEEHEKLARKRRDRYGITSRQRIQLDPRTIEELRTLGYVH